MFNALVLVNAIFPAAEFVAVKLVKLFAPFKVCAPADDVAKVPATLPPLSVIVPAVAVKAVEVPLIAPVNDKLPVVFTSVIAFALVTAPSVKPTAFVILNALAAPELVAVTVPKKLLAFVKLITPALPVKVTAPTPVPLCDRVVLVACDKPIPFKLNVPEPTVTLPNTKPPVLELKRETLPVPVFDKATVPVKLLPVFAKVNPPALPWKLVKPAAVPAVIAVLAACVIPAPFKVKVPLPTATLPRDNAKVSFKLTLFVPPFDNATVPVNALLPANVIAFAPAAIVVVPDTVIMPVCVIAPPLLVILKLPKL
jgi:hypothetical protein